MGVLTALLLGVLACEVYAWLPRIAEAIVCYAVSRLEEGCRARYDEEWKAHLLDIPNAFRIVAALGFVWATRGINLSVREASYNEIDERMHRVTTNVGECSGQVIDLRRQVDNARRGRALADIRDSLSHRAELSSLPAANAFRSLQQFADVLFLARNRQLVIFDEIANTYEAALCRAGHHLRNACELYSQVRSRRTPLPRALQESIETELRSALTTLNNIGNEVMPLRQQRDRISIACDSAMSGLHALDALRSSADRA